MSAPTLTRPPSPAYPLNPLIAAAAQAFRTDPAYAAAILTAAARILARTPTPR